MLSTAGKTGMNSKATFSSGLLHMDTPMLANSQGFTVISFEQTLVALKRTYKERWPIGTDNEWESKESMQSVRIDDDDDDDYILLF